MYEVIVLMAFGGLQVVFFVVGRFHEGHKWEKVARLHLIAVLGHPVVAKTLEDYAVHIVIYSGKVLGH